MSRLNEYLEAAKGNSVNLSQIEDALTSSGFKIISSKKQFDDENVTLFNCTIGGKNVTFFAGKKFGIFNADNSNHKGLADLIHNTYDGSEKRIFQDKFKYLINKVNSSNVSSVAKIINGVKEILSSKQKELKVFK